MLPAATSTRCREHGASRRSLEYHSKVPSAKRRATKQNSDHDQNAHETGVLMRQRRGNGPVRRFETRPFEQETDTKTLCMTDDFRMILSCNAVAITAEELEPVPERADACAAAAAAAALALALASRVRACQQQQPTW